MPPASFMFGPWPCSWKEAFFLTPLSVAIVNHKPIVPGHCLVLSRRVVARFADLTPDEVSDLWCTAQLVSKRLEQHYNAQALTLAIQDGPAAGQTVPHVHIHVLPRRPDDFERNDEVYDKLQQSDASRNTKMDADENRVARSLEEMTNEANQLRNLFTDNSSLPIPS